MQNMETMHDPRCASCFAVIVVAVIVLFLLFAFVGIVFS